eukprot:1530_1
MMTHLWFITVLSLLTSVDSFWINDSPCVSKSLDDYISPTGHIIIKVTTIHELDAAMYTPADHTTILIADGTYDISQLANKRLQMGWISDKVAYDVSKFLIKNMEQVHPDTA